MPRVKVDIEPGRALLSPTPSVQNRSAGDKDHRPLCDLASRRFEPIDAGFACNAIATFRNAKEVDRPCELKLIGFSRPDLDRFRPDARPTRGFAPRLVVCNEPGRGLVHGEHLAHTSEISGFRISSNPQF